MKASTNYNLEDLQNELQLTRDKTQKALDKRELGVLKRVFDVDEEGKPTSVAWECRLPSGDGGERSYEMLRLPWSSFCQSENLLKEISIEFDCDIRENTPNANSLQSAFTLRPRKHSQFFATGKQSHKFKMMLEMEEDVIAETTINGIPLGVFLDESDDLLGSHGTPIYKSLWFGFKSIKSEKLILLAVFLAAALAGVFCFLYSPQI